MIDDDDDDLEKKASIEKLEKEEKNIDDVYNLRIIAFCAREQKHQHPQRTSLGGDKTKKQQQYHNKRSAPKRKCRKDNNENPIACQPPTWHRLWQR